MKRLTLKPDGWPCTLKECPPGCTVLFLDGKMVGLKSEYLVGDKDEVQAFCDSGQIYYGGDTKIIQPLLYEWEDIK